jgi:hypothetical protein
VGGGVFLRFARTVSRWSQRLTNRDLPGIKLGIQAKAFVHTYMGTARGSFAVNVIVFATTRAPGTTHLLILKNGFILDFGE